MEEKSFLKTLREYFETKADNEILMGDKRNIVIPMEWIFTEKVDREVIQRALVQVLKQHRPDYVENYVNSKMKLAKNRGLVDSEMQQAREAELRNQASTKIRDITLNIGRDGLKLVINGMDNWTKAIISENPQKDSKILQVSEDEFCKKILGVLKSDQIKEVLDTFKLNEEVQTVFQTIFATTENQPLDEFSLNGIKSSMAQAAQNLTEYYDYLSKEKEHSRVHSVTINQRQGTKQRRNIPSDSESNPRKSPVYPFMEREKMLRQMNPTHVINVHGHDEDGMLVPNVYTTFVYENPRGKQGKLIVAEPLEGTHSTRIVYMTDEQFETFEVPENADRYGEISKHYLEMSNEEFGKEANATRVNHAEMDTYSQKMQYIISGKDLTRTEAGVQGDYNTILNKLYGKKKITIEDIATVSEKALGDEVKVADGVLDEINSKEKNIEAKGENDG